MPRFVRIIVNLAVLAALLSLQERVFAQQWRPVRGGILFGISGMALVEQQSNSLDFLIVHDNKQKGQGRLALINIKGKNSPEYLPLNWQSNVELPADLEGLTAVPGKTNSSFIAVSSSGKAYHIQVNRTHKTVTVFKVFDLPGITKESNLESFALQEINGKLIAVWAHRGAGEQPAILYWGVFDLAKYQISQIGFVNVKVPFPSGKVRHISDLKIDSAGIVFITSANDTGDDGPFQSGVYAAGYLNLRANKIVFQQNSQLIPLYRFNYHKIEAIELVSGAEGGVMIGTDDENMGSSVYLIGESN